MRGRHASVLFLMSVVSVAAACTTNAAAPHPAKPATGHAAAPTPAGHALGAPGCHPASPVTGFNGSLPLVQGTGHGATLWGLLMFPHPLPARVGDQEKIVWRMTGLGPTITLLAIGPDGSPHRLLWGPAFHTGSNFDKPGGEWGAGYVFTQPGCWDLRAVRGAATADVWLIVIPQPRQA
jgi:hypothetical protein